MQEYDAIRPYDDHEVPSVIERVVNNPELGRAAVKLVMPKSLQGTAVGEWAAGMLLKLKTRKLQTVNDCQLIIAEYFERLIADTITELTVSGLDKLDPAAHYLFMSNHRDIVMDSGLLNFLIHTAGHETCRIAAGDNLMDNRLAADLMRLNKSFVVERSVSGVRAALMAYTRTSSYIRHSLDEGVSIWIAQRQGRAKDGWDRTDPALLKMLALAYKDHDNAIVGLLAHAKLVPVSISYEIDPCALRKAHELSVLAVTGEYDKADEEDLENIILGIVGFKGRVHLHFGDVVKASCTTAEELAAVIDLAIVDGLRIYPTHEAAAITLGDKVNAPSGLAPLPKVLDEFNAVLEACPTLEREYLLSQYANVLRNKQDLNLVTD